MTAPSLLVLVHPAGGVNRIMSRVSDWQKTVDAAVMHKPCAAIQAKNTLHIVIMFGPPSGGNRSQRRYHYRGILWITVETARLDTVPDKEIDRVRSGIKIDHIVDDGGLSFRMIGNRENRLCSGSIVIDPEKDRSFS